MLQKFGCNICGYFNSDGMNSDLAVMLLPAESWNIDSRTMQLMVYRNTIEEVVDGDGHVTLISDYVILSHIVSASIDISRFRSSLI